MLNNLIIPVISENAVRCAILVACNVLTAQEIVDVGPSKIREMFPLFLASLSYQASDPTPLGKGVFQLDVDQMRANTFEFSDILKGKFQTDPEGRIVVTRAFAESKAPKYADIPLVYYFDVEVVRTTLRFRYGLTNTVDAWVELPFQSMGGGRLDALIEGFHRIGFEQYGRDRVAQNRITLVIIEHGSLRFYQDQPMSMRLQDPVLGVNSKLVEGARIRLGLSLAVKPPLTTTLGIYRSGWEQSYSLTGRWEPHPRHIFFFGTGFVRRPKGNEAFSSLPFGSMRDGVGAHVGWEYCRNPRFHPFFHLLWQSPYLRYQPYQKLDRPSLQHDLGACWKYRRNVVLGFHYMNNITHNENTADAGLGLSLSTRF